MKNLSILDQIPCDWFPKKPDNGNLLEGIPRSDLLSSLTTLQNHIFICDTGIHSFFPCYSMLSFVVAIFETINYQFLYLTSWTEDCEGQRRI